MSLQTGTENPFLNLMRYTWILLTVWTLIVAGLLVQEYIDTIRSSNEIALNTARAHLDKDKSFRFWGAMHGGVYVPVRADSPPNPYLVGMPERDIVTRTGRRLTLFNPEYMLRHLNETFSELYGVAGHITSLKPLRPENGPDQWEAAALHQFEQGTKEVMEIVKEPNGQSMLRLMQPLYVKPECMKCHGHQGYKLGDIRGGVGISLPMSEFNSYAHRQFIVHTISLVVLWMLGCIGLFVGSDKLMKSASEIERSNIELQREVEERTKAENALKKESSFTAAVLDTAGALIMVLDVDGRIIRFNQTCEKISGYGADEVTGKIFWDFLLLADKNSRDIFDPATMKEKGLPAKFVNYLITKDKKRRVIDWANTTFLADDGSIEYIISIGIDITEEKQLQDQLLHAEKLSAVGKLSASIAHEINNPLFGIRNVLERLKEKGELNQDNHEFAELAVQECDRIKGLIKDLQDFNRPTSGIATPINLHMTIDNMLLLLKKELENNRIALKKHYDNNIPRIMAVSDQIKQVLLNLLNNALEAIGSDGTITITTRMDAANIIIEISDTGVGIRQEDINQIFEPFFTTKPAVKGTGLGLSVTYGIIKDHGGDIAVQSAVNQGTTFTISLPIEGKKHGR